MAKRQDYIVRITEAKGLLLKGGTSKTCVLRPPEGLRVDSALSGQSAVADATERWLTRSALNCPPSEMHEYTITAEVWPYADGRLTLKKTYKVRYLFSLNRQRKPTRIS